MAALRCFVRISRSNHEQEIEDSSLKLAVAPRPSAMARPNGLKEGLGPWVVESSSA
jgi:hypothetical protein